MGLPFGEAITDEMDGCVDLLYSKMSNFVWVFEVEESAAPVLNRYIEVVVMMCESVAVCYC